MIDGDADQGLDPDPLRPHIAIEAAAGVGATALARRWARDATVDLGLEHLSEDVELVVSELVTNAVLHAGTAVRLHLSAIGEGLRVEVHDDAPERLPVASGTGLLELLELDELDDLVGGLTALDIETMTGRGMTLVEAVADCWGVEVTERSKAVWAEIATGGEAMGPQGVSSDPPVAKREVPDGQVVRVPGVPVRLVLTGAAQLDDLVRELGVTTLPSSLPPDIVDVAADFVAITALVRDPFRAAARAAVEQRRRLLDVSFSLGPEGVGALRGFLAVLEQITELSVRGELLCLAPPPEVMAFRRWAVEEIARQVAGATPEPCPFPVVPPDDPSVEVAARLAAAVLEVADVPDVARGEWLVTAEVALEDAADVSAVAAALVAAGTGLGATTGSLCLLGADGATVELAADIGYADDVREHWSTFPVTADVPAGEVIRTGAPILLRTADELVARFPVFLDSPVAAGSALAVVPVRHGAVRGAMALGFAGPRRFSAEDTALLAELADLVGKALARLSRRPAPAQEGRDDR